MVAATYKVTGCQGLQCGETSALLCVPGLLLQSTGGHPPQAALPVLGLTSHQLSHGWFSLLPQPSATSLASLAVTLKPSAEAPVSLFLHLNSWDPWCMQSGRPLRRGLSVFYFPHCKWKNERGKKGWLREAVLRLPRLGDALGASGFSFQLSKRLQRQHWENASLQKSY